MNCNDFFVNESHYKNHKRIFMLGNKKEYIDIENNKNFDSIIDLLSHYGFFRYGSVSEFVNIHSKKNLFPSSMCFYTNLKYFLCFKGELKGILCDEDLFWLRDCFLINASPFCLYKFIFDFVVPFTQTNPSVRCG